MDTRLALAAALTLQFGCGGNSYNQGIDLDDKDTGSTADTSGAEDTSANEDTDDTDTGEEVEKDTPCINEWHPVHLSGWTKTFDATFEGTAGEAIEEGYGEGTAPDGSTAYVYRDFIGPEGYDSIVYAGCDTDGPESGMFIVAWDAEYIVASTLPFTPDEVYSLHATLTPPRNYLPAEYLTGAVGDWSYEYVIDIEVDKGQPVTLNVSGQYNEAGFETITLFDGTEVEAYKLINNYLTTSDDRGTDPTDGYIEQWWVRGLGLVREVMKDDENGSDILTKELKSYTGLTPS